MLYYNRKCKCLKGENAMAIKSLNSRNISQGPWDGSAGKSACHQAWQPECCPFTRVTPTPNEWMWRESLKTTFFVVRYCAELVPELHSVSGALCSGGRVPPLSSLWDAIVVIALKTKHFGFSRNIFNHFASDSFICKVLYYAKWNGETMKILNYNNL